MSADLEIYRMVLLRKKAELEGSLKQREDFTVEFAPEELDAIHLAQVRDVAVMEADLKTRQLRAINAALARIHDGSYGVCLRYDEPIPANRLQALPFASYCLPCQMIADSETGGSGASVPTELC